MLTEPVMHARGHRLLDVLGVEPRALRALVAAFVLMDLRGQHFAQATATRANYLISPLFWVVGQCLTLSAVTSLLMFARVPVVFFAFLSLGLSWLMTAVLLLVEFDEVVLAPRDLDILGPRPIAPRTLAAARLANLFFYVGLIWLAMNLFPLIVGAALRDAGWAYLPTYLLASVTGTCVTVALVVALVSFLGGRPGLETLKLILAWTQIILILVVGYGGQFMLRDSSFTVQTWAAYPPEWVGWLPPAWLARYVEQAAFAANAGTLAVSAILLVAAAIAVSLTLARLTGVSALAGGPTSAGAAVVSRHPATLRWRRLLRSPEERAGFWLCGLMLRRDAGLLMRCLLPFHLPAAFLLLAMLLDWSGFVAPDQAEGGSVILTYLSLYSVALATATSVYQLASCRDYRGGWLLRGVAEPMACGAAKALVLFLALPCCLLLGAGWALLWGATLGSILFLAALLLCWPAALAGLWLLLPATPFTASPTRGGSLGLPPLPLAGMMLVVGMLTSVTYLFGGSPLFFLALAMAGLGAWALLNDRARRRLRRLDHAT